MALLRIALVASTLLLACSVVSARITAQHVGALNARMTPEELDATSVGDLQPQWLTQKLDHQSLTSTATFQQMYYVNDTFFAESGSPVFFMLGGEGPVTP